MSSTGLECVLHLHWFLGLKCAVSQDLSLYVQAGWLQLLQLSQDLGLYVQAGLLQLLQRLDWNELYKYARSSPLKFTQNNLQRLQKNHWLRTCLELCKQNTMHQNRCHIALKVWFRKSRISAPLRSENMGLTLDKRKWKHHRELLLKLPNRQNNWAPEPMSQSTRANRFFLLELKVYIRFPHCHRWPFAYGTYRDHNCSITVCTYLHWN